MIKRLGILIPIAIGGNLCVAGTATAQVPNQPNCGVTVMGGLSQSVEYDPFTQQSSVSQLPLTLTLNPWIGNTPAKKTQTVNFIFVRPAGSPNIQIIYQGVNVVYEEGKFQGRPVVGSQQSGEIHYNFGGQSQPVLLPNPGETLTVTIPPNANIAAGATIPLAIRYVCSGTGTLPSVDSPLTVPTGATLNVTVKSGLQASYVGAAINFGEVGDKLDSEAGTIAARTGDIRVASSGPYTVSVNSPNGYRMTYDLSKIANEIDNLRYQVEFAGGTKSAADTGALSRTCSVNSGIGSPTPLAGGRLHPIKVTLLEGGREETPSSNYSDVLEVTVTPLAAGSAGLSCP